MNLSLSDFIELPKSIRGFVHWSELTGQSAIELKKIFVGAYGVDREFINGFEFEDLQLVSMAHVQSAIQQRSSTFTKLVSELRSFFEYEGSSNGESLGQFQLGSISKRGTLEYEQIGTEAAAFQAEKESSIRESQIVLIEKARRNLPLSQSWGLEELLRKSMETSEFTRDLEGMTESIYSLRVSIRASNGLIRGGIRTIGELFLASESDLRDIQYFGEKSLNEIESALKEWCCERSLMGAVLISSEESGDRSLPIFQTWRLATRLNEVFQLSEDYRELIEIVDAIRVLELSVRAYNCLFRSEILTMGELLLTSEQELQDIRNLGDNTLLEIQKAVVNWCNDLPSYQPKELHSTSISLADAFPHDLEDDSLVSWRFLDRMSENALKSMYARIIGGQHLPEEGFKMAELRKIPIAAARGIPNVGDAKLDNFITALWKACNEVSRIREEAQKAAGDLSRKLDSIRVARDLNEIIDSILNAIALDVNMDKRMHSIVKARAAWATGKPRTLDEIGQEWGVTRERVRQIMTKFDDLFRPPILNSVNLLEKFDEIAMVSSTAAHFLEAVFQSNLASSEIFTIDQLVALTGLIGTPKMIVSIDQSIARWSIQTQSVLEIQKKLTRFRGKTGLIDLRPLMRIFPKESATVKIAIQTRYPRALFSENLVLARNEAHVSGMEASIAKQLLVCDGLTPEEMLEGIHRFAKYRGDSLINCDKDLVALIRQMAGDKGSREGFLSQLLEIDGLSDSDRMLVAMFKNSESGLLHRTELQAAAMDQGINLGSLTMYLSTAPYVRALGKSVYALVGTRATEEDIALTAQVAKSSYGESEYDISWVGDDLLLTIRPNVVIISSGVIFPPKIVKEMIFDRFFECECECGELITEQNIRISETGFLIGFTALFYHGINKHGQGIGDEFKILFSFSDSRAILK